MHHNDQIDFYDAAYAAERAPSIIVRSIPAPLSIKDGVEHINPHVSRFELKGGQTMDVFHVKPIYYLHQNGGWRPMGEIAHAFGNKWIDLKEDWAQSLDLRYLAWLMKRMELIQGAVRIPSPFRVGEYVALDSQRIHFTVTTFFPDPNPETTTVDGYVGRISSTVTWATIIAGAGTTKNDSDADSECMMMEKIASGDSYDALFRSIFLFDTSAIPDTDTISGAILSLKGTTKGDNIGCTPDINIYGSTPASNTALVNADFTQVGSTAYATAISYASYSTSAYNDFTFNGTGIAAISKTGVSKFGARNANYDVAAVTPSTSGVIASSWMNCNMADVALTTSDPKLAVTYTSSTAYTKTLTETPTATASLIKGPVRTLAETVTSTATIIKTTTRTLTQTVTSTATFTRVWTIGRTLTEGVTSTATYFAATSRTLSETITATDTFSRVVTFGRNLTEAISASASVIKATSRTLADSAAAADTIIRTATRLLTESATASASFMQTVSRTLAESITASDVFAYVQEKTAILTEAVEAVDTFLRSIGRTLEEAIIALEALVSSRETAATLSETITASDTVLKTASRTLSDVLTVTDTVIRTVQRTLEEALAAVDTILRGFATTLTDNVTATSTNVRDTARTLYETTSATGSVIRTVARTLFESLTATDTFIHRFIASPARKGLLILRTAGNRAATLLGTSRTKIVLKSKNDPTTYL
jgi:hypothetical protein